MSKHENLDRLIDSAISKDRARIPEQPAALPNALSKALGASRVHAPAPTASAASTSVAAKTALFSTWIAKSLVILLTAAGAAAVVYYSSAPSGAPNGRSGAPSTTPTSTSISDTAAQRTEQGFTPVSDTPKPGSSSSPKVTAPAPRAAAQAESGTGERHAYDLPIPKRLETIHSDSAQVKITR